MPTGLAQNLSFILLGEDKSASKTMTGAQQVAEKVTGRIGGAFSKVGGIIGGEFGGVLSEVGNGITELGQKGVKLGSTLAAAGGIAASAGVALMQLGSSEKQSTDQLKASIKSAGDSWDSYEKKIDAAIAKQEDFAHSAVDTKTALGTLVGATGDTQQALNSMGVVADLAAAKHESLAAAAKDIAKILNGSGTKTLSQYGITMEKAYDNTKDLESAQLMLTKSTQKVGDAQAHLVEIEAIDAGRKKLTIAQQYALAAAHKKVADAEAVVSQAQQNLNDLQGTSVTKTMAGKDAIDQLSKKLDGQAKASMNNFGAQVDAVRTKVVDWVEEMAGPAGQWLSVIGTVVGIAGTALDFYNGRQERRIALDIEAAAAATTAAAATDTETVAMVGLDGAMDANPIGIVAGALGILAGVVGGTLLLGGLSKAKIETEDLTGAIKADNDAIGTNTRLQVADALIKSGAASAAGKLGISMHTLTDAAIGNTAAQAQVNAVLETLHGKIANVIDANGNLLPSVRGLTNEQRNLGNAYVTVRDALNGQNQSVDKSVKKLNLERQATENLSASMVTLLQQEKQLNATLSASGSSQRQNRTALPHHALGGDISSSQYSLVGENGPEVVALPGGSHVFPSGQGPSGSGGGGIVLNVTVQGSVSNTKQFGKEITTALINTLRSGGVSKTELKTALGV